MFHCPDDPGNFAATDKPSSYGMNANFALGGYIKGGTPNKSIIVAAMNAPSSTVMLFEVQGNQSVDVTSPLEGPYPVNYGGSPFGNGSVQGYSPAGGGSMASCPPSTGATLKYATGYMGGRSPSTYACFYTTPDGAHAGGSNFLMADCHAKWFRGSQVSSGRNATDQNAAEQVYMYGNAAGTSGTLPGGAPAGATFSIN